MNNLGLPAILTILFVVFKIFGIITWSWWWVFAPIWITFLIVIVIYVVIFIFMFLGAILVALIGE